VRRGQPHEPRQTSPQRPDEMGATLTKSRWTGWLGEFRFELGVYQVDFDRSGSPTEVAGLSLGPPAPLARERRVLAAAGVGGATRLTCLS
jgi:hypothetical protein